jgi:nucleoid-associated protein YgaU
MRVFSVVLLVGVAAMWAAGCESNNRVDVVPPVESIDQPPVVVKPIGTVKPVTGIDDSSILSRPQTYTVQKGDTLYSLAKRYYGDGKLWTKIADANKDKIRDAQSVPIGTVLTIPPK